jgi:hypothetical protein
MKTESSRPVTAAEARHADELRSLGFATDEEFRVGLEACREQAQRAADFIRGTLAADSVAARALVDDLVVNYIPRWLRNHETTQRSRRPARVAPFRVLAGGRSREDGAR